MRRGEEEVVVKAAGRCLVGNTNWQLQLLLPLPLYRFKLNTMLYHLYQISWNFAIRI